MRKFIKLGIFLVTIIIIFVVIAMVMSQDMESKEVQQNEEINILNSTLDLQELQAISEYESINKCVEKYTNYIKGENREALYSIIDNNYKQSNSITKDNILNKLSKINYTNIYIAKKIYYIEVELGIRTYFVQGIICNKENKKTDTLNLVLNVDSSNNTFEIAPLGEEYLKYIDFENKKVDEKQIQNKVNNIEENEFNKAEVTMSYDEKNIMNFYFKRFITDLIYNREDAFNNLDTSYKTKRFENYEQFNNYIKQNEQDIEKSIIVKYKAKEYDKYKEFLCRDNYGNYYIFKEKEPMNYTVMLDQYTINDRIFTDVYSKKDNKEKALLNLNKFEQMLNRRDYKKAYSILNEEFKEKYFETEEKFVNYIQNNFYKYNEFSYTEASAENEKYKITTTIKNVQNTFKENFVKRFKVELLDNTDFSISFDM